MPDKDVLNGVVAPGWARPYRLLAGGASTQEVARATLHALTKSLRTKGGMPGLDALSGVVDGVVHQTVTPRQALSQLRAISQAFGHRHTAVAAQAAAQLVAEHEHGLAPPFDNALGLAERACERLIDHHLFGRARPRLLGERFATHVEAKACEATCKALLQPQLAKVARNLVGDEQASHLRAPRTPGAGRRPTADLLGISLTS